MLDDCMAGPRGVDDVVIDERLIACVQGALLDLWLPGDVGPGRLHVVWLHVTMVVVASSWLGHVAVDRRLD